MDLRLLASSLRHEVSSRKHQTIFEDARSREPALSRHHTPLEAVDGDEAGDGNTKRSPESYAQRDDLVRALMRSHHTQPHPLFTSMLILAYLPMLSRLRRRILGHQFLADDLDQMVVHAFLETIADRNLAEKPDRTSLRLRQATERRVFKQLRIRQRERTYPLPRGFENTDHRPWPETSPVEPRRTTLAPGDGPHVEDEMEPHERAAQLALLRDIGSSAFLRNPGDLELLSSTLICGKRLSRLVDERYPELPLLDRRRVYERIKRRHSRALAKLRARLVSSRRKALCGDDEPPIAA